MASKDGLKKWQVFTPNVIVKKILTTVHYNNYQILDRRILENSCGEGHFLEEIVKRYIFYGLKKLKFPSLFKLYYLERMYCVFRNVFSELFVKSRTKRFRECIVKEWRN